MKTVAVAVLFFTGACLATDVTTLPFNTWTSVPITMDMQGHGGTWGWVAGYSSATYDKDRGQMLLADGYQDADRAISIYTNCIYSYDLDSNTMIYRKAHHWTVVQHASHYTTDPLPANATDSTPPPRHIYNGFLYVQEKNALYMLQGANQSIVAAYAAHLQNLWIYAFDTGKWREVAAPFTNRYEGHLRYINGSGKLYWFSGGGCSSTSDFWEFDLDAETWTHKAAPAICVYGSESATDPQRERIVIFSGGFGFYSDQLLAYVPSANRLDTLQPQNAGPSDRYYGQILYNHKYDVYMVINGCEQPGDWNWANDGWVYDPRTDLWESAPDPPNGTENIIYDPKREVVLYYTRDKTTYLQDCWALRYKRAGAPEAAFSASAQSGSAPLSVDLDASASTDDGTIALYEWDFGYGWEAFNPQDSGISAAHVFSTDGIYTVALRVTDSENKSTITTREIAVGNTGLCKKAAPGSVSFSAWPNPFNPTLYLSVSGEVKVAIYNARGAKVKEFPETLTGTKAVLAWDAAHLPSGVYFVRALANRKETIRRVTLLK